MEAHSKKSQPRLKSPRRSTLPRELIPFHVRHLIPDTLPDKQLYLAITIAVSAFEAGKQAGKLEGAMIPMGAPTIHHMANTGTAGDPTWGRATTTSVANDWPEWAEKTFQVLAKSSPGINWKEKIKTDKVFGPAIKDGVDLDDRLCGMRINNLLQVDEGE